MSRVLVITVVVINGLHCTLQLTAPELCEVEVAVHNSPHGLCGRKATLILNLSPPFRLTDEL